MRYGLYKYKRRVRSGQETNRNNTIAGSAIAGPAMKGKRENMSEINKLVLDRQYNYTMNSWDAFIEDLNGDLIAKADALSESAVSLATEMTDKKGGSSNLTLYSIPSSRELTVTMTNLDFDERRIALQTGEKFNLGKFTVEGRTASCPVAVNGDVKTITLPETPVGNHVYLEMGNSTIAVPVPAVATSMLDVSDYLPQGVDCVRVIYAAEVESEQLDIGGSTPPAVVRLVLKKKVLNGSSGIHVKTITITIPKFQLDGNLEFAGTLGDSDTTALNGKAIASVSGVCGNAKQVLGTLNVETVSGASVYAATQISATPDIGINAGDTDSIIVMGVKESEAVYAPFEVTDKCTFVSSDETKVTVDGRGNVTGVATTTDPVIVTASFNGLTAKTNVTVG